MAVRLRMSRRGKKKRPFYHIRATTSRSPRDGAFIEEIGVYDPLGETFLKFNEVAARKWLAAGASPSATVKSLLRRAGLMPGRASLAQASAAAASVAPDATAATAAATTG